MIEGSGGYSADEPFVVRDAARSEVLTRHARLSKKGRPVFCTPSQREIRGAVRPRAGRGTDGKVIYSTREDAEAAARELERLGSRTLRAYLCGRSRGGHYHLATDTAVAPRPLHERIPRQHRAPAAARPPVVPAQRTVDITPLQFAALHQRIPQQRRLAG